MIENFGNISIDPADVKFFKLDGNLVVIWLYDNNQSITVEFLTNAEAKNEYNRLFELKKKEDKKYASISTPDYEPFF